MNDSERAELEELRKRVSESDEVLGIQRRIFVEDNDLHVKRAYEAEAQVGLLKAEVAELKASKRAAYAERQRITVAFARVMHALGCTVGTRQHDPSDTTWDKQWMTILYIDLPTGQVSWHFHDSFNELLLNEFPKYEKEWDKHDTYEKYRRLLALNLDRTAKDI